MALPKIFAEIGLKIDGFEKAAGDVSKRLNAIDRDAQRALSGFQKMGDRLTEVGKSLSIGISVPLAAAAAAATKFATGFDLEMRKVTSLLGSEAPKSFAVLSAAVLEVSKRLGVDAVKSAQALYEALSAGVPKENAATFLEIATKAAIAGVTDTKVAVDALTSAMNAYGPANLSAKQAADEMFQAVNIGKFTFEQLAASLSIATPLAAQLGISFKEILAPAATLTSQGFSISEAMTAIRAAIVGILSPNKQMNELLAKLGVVSGEALIKQKGLQGAFEALREAAGGSTQAIQEALGRVEGLGAVLGTTGANAEKARADLTSLGEATKGAGAATQAFEEINKSTARQFEQLTSRLKTTAIELGVSLLPAINSLLKSAEPLLQFLADAVKWFTSLPSPIQTTVLAVLAAVTAIGPLTAGLGLAISSMVSFVGALGSVGSAIVGVVVPQLVAFGSAVGNVVYAVATGMTGALVGGEAALLKFGVVLGQVALVAGTAFAAFQIGSVLYENIPAVKAFGDAIADLILKIPGVTTLIEKLTGASAAAARASGDLDFATKKLESSLKAKGITIDKTGKSADEYAAALRAAGAEAGKLDKASDTAQIEKYKKQIQDSQKQAALYAKAQEELGVKTAAVAKEHRDAHKPLENLSVGTQLLAARMAILRGENAQAVTSLANLKLAIDRGKAGSVDWSAELVKLNREMESLGRASDDITKIKLPAWAAEIPKITRPNQDLIDALGRLGIKSKEEYKRVADEAAKARDAVLGSGVASDFEKKTAIYKALQAQVEYSKVAGIEITREQRDALDQLGKDLDNKLPEQKRKWDSFTNSVSTAISNFSQDIVKSLFEGEGSWAEKGINALKKLGQAVLNSFVEPATAALTEFLNGVIKDLLGGKGFGGLLDGIKGIGSGLSGIFGGGGGLSQGAGIPSTVPGIGGVLGGGGAAGGASGAAGAASGLTGALTAVGAIGSFATGVINAFQMSSLNKNMGRVEESTRFTAIALIGPGGVIDTERTFLPWLEIIGKYLYGVQQPWFVDVSIYLERVIDSLAMGYETARESVMMLSDIRGQLEFQNQLALEGSGASGITINVTGNTFATSGQVDQFVSVLVDRIQRSIGYR